MGKKLKVLIVDALGSGGGVRFSSRDAVGCGPRAIAGVLRSSGVDSTILLAERFIEEPSVADEFGSLFVSAMSIDLEAVQKVIWSWRRRHGSQLAVIGGPIASQPEILLNSGFDIVIVGEGETSVSTLLKEGLDNEKLKKCRKRIILSGESYGGKPEDFSRWAKEKILQQVLAKGRGALDLFQPSVSNVRDYPGYRALRFYVEVVRGCSNFQRAWIPMQVGRKCVECQKCREGEIQERVACPINIPPGCGYCSVPSLFGCSRSRTEDAIISEVRELMEAGIRRLVLSASDFLDYERDQPASTRPLTNPCYPPANLERIESLLSKLVSLQQTLGISDRDYVYMSVENIKPCLFNDDVASIIASYLPESTIHIGCETGSEEHSLRLGRPSTPAQALDAVSVAARRGLRPYVYFIHGLPGQTAQTARETIEMMKRMAKAGAEKITLYKFKPLPFSAFEMYPPAPPAKKNDDSNRIERIARELNMVSKNKLLDKTIDVIALGYISRRDSEGTVSYPVKDGPVVVLSEKHIKQGTRLKAKITEVLSDRLVKGETA
jgi:radical SAM superfamily enzyme YgiQ (UPF0313 family)